VNPPAERDPSSEATSSAITTQPEPSDELEHGAVPRTTVVRGGTLASLGVLASQAISFVGFIVLARLAPPRTFGVYAAASILLITSQIFTDSGMRAAVIQRRDRVEEAASTAFTANVVGGVLLAAIAAGCAPLIGLFFHSGEIARAAAVMAGVIVFNSVSIIPEALLQRRVSFRLPLVGPLGSFAYVAVAVATLATGLGVWGLVAATYVTAVVRAASVFALSRWRPSPHLVSWEMWRSLTHYGWPVLLSLFLREVGFAGSTALVGRLLGTGDLGRFRFAQRVALQLNSAVVVGGAYVLLPAFSRIWQDERRFQDSILRAMRILTLIVFPLSLAFIPLGQPFATIFLGTAWRETGSILIAMSGVGVALVFDSISSEAFKATGQTKFLPRMHALTAVVPLALMFAFKNLGAPGMGLGLSLGMLTVAAYATWALSGVARIPLRVIESQIRPALLAASLMAVCAYLLDRHLVHAGQHERFVGLSLFALDLLIAVALYFGSLLILSRGSVNELKEVGKLLVSRTESSASTALG
jgi:O-antigen/teichoic acid export membrane protein